MNKSKIEMDMHIRDTIVEVADGNIGALNACMEIINTDLGLNKIEYLYAKKIYGSKLYMLWNDCCNRNIEWFNKTVDAFNNDDFTDDEIHENLNQGRATPFVPSPRD